MQNRSRQDPESLVTVETPPSEAEPWHGRCGWCGSLNPDRALYCIQCGAAIDSRALAPGTSRSQPAGLASTSLPLNAAARSLYFAMGAGAYLLVAMGLIMVTPSSLWLPLLALQGLMFVYLASVGRYGRSSPSRFLIMILWALIPPLIIYYVGKGLVAYAALDRAGLIRTARTPATIFRQALSALIPLLLILALAVGGVALLRFAGVQMPSSWWETATNWIAHRWPQIDPSRLAQWARDVYTHAQAWVATRAIP